MPDNKISLTAVVSGTPTEVTANVNAPLKTIIPEALRETGNNGQPPDNWDVKDAAGNILDPNKKIGDFGFTDGVTVFLTLKAGIGG
ncbi:MAG: DUF2604 domain-containing protein [Blastocatellia bacterium]|nr:DUF2604 domain-containing protein [Blastocatellia bacterium]